MFGLFKKPEGNQTLGQLLNQTQPAPPLGLQPQKGLGGLGKLGAGAAGTVVTSTSQYNVFTNQQNHQEVHVESNLDFATVKRCLVILTDYVDILLEKQLNSEFVTIATEEKKIPDLRYLIKYLKGVVDDASNYWSVQQQQAAYQHQISQAKAAALYPHQYAGQTSPGPYKKPNPPTTGSGVSYPTGITFVSSGSG